MGSSIDKKIGKAYDGREKRQRRWSVKSLGSVVTFKGTNEGKGGN